MRGLLFSVTKWCLTFCSRTDCSTPGLPVHHYLPEFAQVHVHVELSHWKRPWCCKDWGQKEKRVAENEMRWLDGIPAQWTTRGYSPVKIKDKSSEKRLGILEPRIQHASEVERRWRREKPALQQSRHQLRWGQEGAELQEEWLHEMDRRPGVCQWVKRRSTLLMKILWMA